MRMARVNITVPDDVVTQVKAAGLNVSRLATAALVEELDRRSKIAALDTYLAELEAEFGQIPATQRNAAVKWADQRLAVSSANTQTTARPQRSA